MNLPATFVRTDDLDAGGDMLAFWEPIPEPKWRVVQDVIWKLEHLSFDLSHIEGLTLVITPPSLHGLGLTAPSTGGSFC